MKKILLYLLCLSICATFAVPAMADEDHEHGDVSSTVSSVTLSPDLDQDGDGIPDYMDGIIDIDGDGVGDVGPTYRQPPEESIFKNNAQFPWGIVLGVSLFIGIVAATIILKVFSKKKKEDKHV